MAEQSPIRPVSGQTTFGQTAQTKVSPKAAPKAATTEGWPTSAPQLPAELQTPAQPQSAVPFTDWASI